MQLTKTDFIQYCNCPKSLWLLKHKPKDFDKKEFSLFLEKLIAQGAEVENWAQKLFPGGASLFEYGTLEKTQEALKKSDKAYFQAAFGAQNGAFARVDVLERLDDGTWHIYEVKSSSAVKKDPKHNHLKDAAFQKYVIEQCDLKVSKVSIIHLNTEYVRNGEINPYSLLKTVDVTEQIEEIYEQVSLEIEEALKLLAKEEINEKECSCRLNTRTNHCDSFEYFNPDIPEFSIYEIGRLGKNKIQLLVDAGVLKISDIDSSFEFNDKQELQIQSVKSQESIIDFDLVKEQMAELKFPLHFIDYETVSNAVPKIDGTKPYQHIPFQVSIHTMRQPTAHSSQLTANGEQDNVEHFEFLADKLELPENMLKEMKKFTGDGGTYISWHKSFEQGRNREMAEMFPEFSDYLTYMNDHMFDLEDIFKEAYVDYRFHGSTSIKAVLPVFVPELSYKNLEVQNGTMAMDTWERMVSESDENFVDNKEETRKNLLKYCELDTFAMVEIYRKLKKL